MLPQGDDLTLIQLRELPSYEWILDLRTAAAEAGVAAPGAADGGRMGDISSAERLVLLQQKIEQKSATLALLQEMGQAGQAIAALHQEVCTTVNASRAVQTVLEPDGGCVQAGRTASGGAC